MKPGLRSYLAATAITLVAFVGVAAAAPPPSPAAADATTAGAGTQCADSLDFLDPEAPEATPKLSLGCSENGTEIYICTDRDILCGGCSSGHCAFLAYESYQWGGSYYRSCHPQVTRCTSACTFDLPCNELCA